MISVRHRLEELVAQAALEAQSRGLLPTMALPPVTVEHPQNPEHGDFASSLPLKLARAARMSPLAIAQVISDLVPPAAEVAQVAVAAPGFVNFTLRDEWLAQQMEAVLAAADGFGNIDLGQGRTVQVEFVSANPTGPLHVGHGRGAVLGSALANILQAAGFAVQREYYLNDTGNQVDTFARSLWARYLQALGREAEIPDDGYHGAYMKDLAQEIIAEEGDRFLSLPETEAPGALAEVGLAKMIAAIREDLDRLGVSFDDWFSERSLYSGGQYEAMMQRLRRDGYIAEKEGAVWFASTALGEDKDNVIVRSTGVPTYFASDIAYHYNKFLERGFERVIDIWGADHQGHVPRMKGVVAALGINPERLQVIISQLVTLRRGGEVVRLSKRSGDIISLREVIDDVGPDACRYFFLSRAASSQMDFDLELAKRQAPENPVYYVQYAHARIASILRLATERGIAFDDGDVAQLTTQPELALVRKLLLLPEIVEQAAQSLEPHYLPHYALELATTFHDFYEKCRVIGDDEALTKARLKLVAAAKIVLARALGLMGMTAPEQM